MIRHLSKIEARDNSPLDVPGRPLMSLSEGMPPETAPETVPEISEELESHPISRLRALLRPKPSTVEAQQPPEEAEIKPIVSRPGEARRDVDRAATFTPELTTPVPPASVVNEQPQPSFKSGLKSGLQNQAGEMEAPAPSEPVVRRSKPDPILTQPEITETVSPGFGPETTKQPESKRPKPVSSPQSKQSQSEQPKPTPKPKSNRMPPRLRRKLEREAKEKKAELVKIAARAAEQSRPAEAAIQLKEKQPQLPLVQLPPLQRAPEQNQHEQAQNNAQGLPPAKTAEPTKLDAVQSSEISIPTVPPLPPQPPRGGGTSSVPGRGRLTPHSRGILANLRFETDLSISLLPLLEALKWRGDVRHVAEAIPHFIDELDITSFRNILASLNYESRSIDLKLKEIDPRLMPCLFLPEDGDAIILIGLEQGYVNIFESTTKSYQKIPFDELKGTVYLFKAIDHEDILSTQQKIGWFRAVGERFRGLVYQTLGITFVLNLLALSTPLFVMAVYDKVVATGSLSTLAFFAIGVGIAVLCDLVLRSIRTRILSFIGARLNNIIGIAIFHKILFMPPAFTERATIGAQVARIKDFENIRDFFTGPMALVLFELPFVVIFISVIAFLGGPVAFVPIIMIALFAIVGMIFSPLIRRGVSQSARAASQRQELVVEALSGMRALKYCGAESNWIERFRTLSAKSSLHGFYSSQYSSVVQTVSNVLMVSSGITTIVFGVFRVLSGDMTIGALVASMMLVWRVLGPLQTAFVSITRLTQVKSSITQVNNLMNIKAERDQHSTVPPLKRLQGHISFGRVSIRYSADADPALVGVTFDVQPGEVVCIVGGNGSGKSSVLKLLAGMYQPQAGSIRLDNSDIRQIDPIELRHAVAYVPQGQQFFYGTIAQNLRMAHPTATEEELRWAVYKAGALEDIEGLIQGSGKWKRTGFEVRIGDTGGGQMTTSLLQRLNLARGYLKRAQIMLFDEPGNGLDFEDDKRFMRMVDEMRGETTILIVTHRPSHLKLADKIVWLEEGAVKAEGPAAEVLKQLPKDFL